jgi:hypothetical protein
VLIEPNTFPPHQELHRLSLTGCTLAGCDSCAFLPFCPSALLPARLAAFLPTCLPVLARACLLACAYVCVQEYYRCWEAAETTRLKLSRDDPHRALMALLTCAPTSPPARCNDGIYMAWLLPACVPALGTIRMF